MTWETLIAFNVILLASIASPGPALLIAIRTSLQSGRSAGIRLGFGLATIACCWTGAALLGLHTLFEWFPFVYTIVKTIGATYLLYIAWNTWRDAAKPLNETIKIARRPFRDGALVNLANPKSVLFASAVLVLIFPPDISISDKAVIVFNHFLMEIVCYTLIAFALSTKAASSAYLKMKRWFDRFAAITLGALGLRLLMQK